MAAKKKTAKKRAPLPDAKALNAAKKRHAAAKKKAAEIQGKIAEQKAIAAASPEGGKAFNVANQKAESLTASLGKAQTALAAATQQLSTATESRARALRAAGYGTQAESLASQSRNLTQTAQRLGATATSNQYQGPAQTNQDTLMGGALGLANTVNQSLPAAGQAGQGLVGLNLGEVNTALMGGQGQTGLLGLLQQASSQAGANTAASQAQQISGIGSMAGDTRTALQKLSPEVARATKAFGLDLSRAQGLAAPTGAMTSQGLAGQAGLARQATNQATNYRDPMLGDIRRAGWSMNQAAGKTGQIANQATSQALNYQDPTAGLAAGAISGFQGLAGLQQSAAEDAYARSRQLSPEQMREADQAARESFGARGMIGSTGSVASEILNRESSIAARRAEAAGLGQLAQQGQSGLVGLASGYESDTLGRRTGLQQNAAGLQGLASGQYGAAGGFMSDAETARLQRRLGNQVGAMGLATSALGSQAAARGESEGAARNLFGSGQFYSNAGLPLMTQGTAGQSLGLGLLSSGLGMSGQGSGVIQAGSNIGMSRWTTEQEKEAAYRAAKASEKAGLYQGIGSTISGLGSLFSLK